MPWIPDGLQNVFSGRVMFKVPDNGLPNYWRSWLWRAKSPSGNSLLGGTLFQCKPGWTIQLSAIAVKIRISPVQCPDSRRQNMLHFLPCCVPFIVTDVSQCKESKLQPYFSHYYCPAPKTTSLPGLSPLARATSPAFISLLWAAVFPRSSL